MKKTPIGRNFRFAVLCAVVLSQAVFGWDVPITVKPTRKIETALLGDWYSGSWSTGNPGNALEKVLMKVRKFDDFSYVVSWDGHLYRAFHSDIAGVPFLSVQDIDSTDREYWYVTWNLSGDGKRLEVRAVNDHLVPAQTRAPATVARILRRNVKSSELLDGGSEFFTRGP